jgi:hypothetical protein
MVRIRVSGGADTDTCLRAMLRLDRAIGADTPTFRLPSPAVVSTGEDVTEPLRRAHVSQPGCAIGAWIGNFPGCRLPRPGRGRARIGCRASVSQRRSEPSPRGPRYLRGRAMGLVWHWAGCRQRVTRAGACTSRCRAFVSQVVPPSSRLHQLLRSDARVSGGIADGAHLRALTAKSPRSTI